MAESAQIISVSSRHKAIADWLLLYPERKLRECAEHFGVSQPWLSVVLHSKAFVEYFNNRRAGYESVLRERIQGAALEVALKAYQQLSEVLDDESQCDGRLTLDIAEKTAKLLGFEPRASVRTRFIEETERSWLRPTTSVVLAEAREKMTRRVVKELTVQEPVDEPAG
jgi:hypothetical protein